MKSWRDILTLIAILLLGLSLFACEKAPAFAAIPLHTVIPLPRGAAIKFEDRWWGWYFYKSRSAWVRVPWMTACAPPATFFKPLESFGKDEVKVFRMLRDYPDGKTGSRPQKWILIYGQHPLWTHVLREAGFKVIGFWHRKVHWPGYVVGDPLEAPFEDKMFQVYLYDDYRILTPYGKTVKWLVEVDRLIADEGFFLYRLTHNGRVDALLKIYGWRRMDFDFHEFGVYQRESA